MPKKLFFELKDEKRTKIIETAISEFARYDYNNSSTNRIVKDAGISKGSLFKYFESKEDIYFYILDCVTEELMLNLKEKLDKLPTDLFKRVIKYSELEFDWYINNPKKYKLIINAFGKNDTEIYQKTKTRYNLIGQDIYYKILGDISINQFKFDKQKTIDILKWFLKGFNEEFINKVHVQNCTDIDYIRDKYVESLSEHMEVLKNGLI